MVAAHLLRSILSEAPLEFVMGIEWRGEVLVEAFKVKDGSLVVPDRSGLVVELNLEGVEKHRWHPRNSYKH